MTDFLAVHWLGVILLALAGVFAALRRWHTAASLALVALGGLVVPPSVVHLTDETRFTLGELAVIAAIIGWLVAGAVLVIFRGWSYWAGLALGAFTLFAVGAWVVRPVAAVGTEAVGSMRGLQFVRPWWLVLLALVPVILLISRRSLSGLGPVRRRVAIASRATIVALLALALAEPRLRQPSEHVTVLFAVDRSYSVPQDLDPDRPATDAVDRRWERVREFLESAVVKRGPARRNDQSGLILFGRRPRLALPPAAVERMPVDERLAGPIDGNYTDISAAIKLALASFPEGTAKRIVLVSDGNENIGSAEEQAAIAKQNGVQIDTIALAPGYRNESEVLVQAVEAPSVTAQGQRLPVRVLVRNASPNRVVDGRLEVLKSSQGENRPIQIEESDQVLEANRDAPPKVRLFPGLNVFRFRDRADPLGDASFAYRATFTPLESRPMEGGAVVAGVPGDRAANNRAAAAVVSRGQRRVLFLDDNRAGTTESTHAYLLDSLRREKVRVDRLPADRLPADKNELGVFLNNFDCVVLANVPYEKFSQDQAETIRSAVFDQGCGLVMIGGPDSFGPGGYQGTPIEAALPVDCEIKALKAAGKGGLVLVMHASEMAQGNFWQKQIAKLAITRLSPADMVGVAQYGFGGGAGVSWWIPFQTVGENKQNLLSRVDTLTPGDMPHFDPFLRAAADTLKDPQHNLAVKHTIVISDGDPQLAGAGRAALADMAANAITCTTVGVATHGVNEDVKMKEIADSTRDGEGKPGTFYKVSDPSQLPAIYIKESRRVSQSFIADQKFTPAWPRDRKADIFPQITELPPLYGFVRTTLKANALAGFELEAPSPYPDQRFPVLAAWRYGLGKAVAFTSDARTQPGADRKWWDRDWVGSDGYQKFWKQTIEWAMREAERGKLTLVTEYRDGRVRVIADVRDEKDRPVTGVSLRGAVSVPTPPGPGEKPPAVEFKPRGGGRYEAEFPAEEAGSYFLNVQAQEIDRGADGQVILNPDGTPKMRTVDAARAGVTVPYSPEFADLESNTPLMKRLAELTGGNFYTEAAEDLDRLLKSGDLFRPGPESTRAILPFWHWLVFAAGLLLLIDVGVRRIAIEAGEVRTAAIRFWASLREQPVQEESAGLGQLLRRKAAVSEVLDRGRSSRRFEPGAGPMAEPPPAGADDYAARTSSDPPLAPPPAGDREVAKPAADDPFERLRKAKERAKHRRDGEDEADRR
jgi:uncharacterized membrane protein